MTDSLNFRYHAVGEEAVFTENFIIALNTVLPMFLMILVGCIVKKTGMISTAAASQTNRMCFRVFVSVLMFSNLYYADVATAFNPTVLLFCVVGVLLEFFVSFPLVSRVEKTPSVQSVMVQGLFRSNIILFGLPMCASLFGSENVGEMSILTVVLVPMVNVLAVIDLELLRGGKPNVRHILRGIALNPLILGAAFGLFFLLTGLRLPRALESVVDSFAGVATPLALVLLGTSLDFQKLAASFRNLVFCTAMRLVVFPAVFLSLAIFLGFRDLSLGCMLFIFASPVAVNSYTMAAEMGGDSELAAGIVVSTTAFSCLTLFLWIFLFKTWGLF